MELFDLFAGTDTGYLKGCRLPSKQSVHINKLDRPSKQLGINCMAWVDDIKTKICVGAKNGEVFCYDLQDSTCNQIHPNQRLLTDPPSKVILRAVQVSDESKIVLAFDSGLVKVGNMNHIIQEENQNIEADKKDSDEFEIQLQVGDGLYCMDQCLHTPSLIATGGKNNSLKIWDISKHNELPVFKAKNVKNDWLNLQVPIWETKVKFLPNEKKVITATGYSHIRMYDPSTIQRRPVIEMKFEEKPITALCLRPGYENQVVVGNTIGSVALLDLRKKGIVKKFRGCKGGVTDIQFHPSKPYFASCGVDRFVNCYEFDNQKIPIYSIYMQSALNCLLFSSNWSADDARVPSEKSILNKDKVSNYDKEDIEGGDDKDLDDGDEQNDENIDDILGKMDVVKTKKRKIDHLPSKGKKRKSS